MLSSIRTACWHRITSIPAIKSLDCSSQFTFSRALYYHKQHTLRKNQAINFHQLAVQHLSTSSRHCFSEKSNDDDSKSNVVDLDDEFQSYIDEIRREFAAEEDFDEQPVSEQPSVTPKSVQEKYTTFDDDIVEVILDESELYDTLARGEESPYFKTEKPVPLQDLKRGVEGVFDLHEIVDLLKEENIFDICAVKVPTELHYTDFLVIGSCKSVKHLSAVANYVRKVHKKKKNPKDSFLKIEGDQCPDWKAIDLGNIVLHLFMPETREKYDVEMLWAVGEQYDDLFNKAEDPLLEAIQRHTVYLDDMQPISAIHD